MARQQAETILDEVVERTQSGPSVHVRFDGRSIDISVADLDLGDASDDNAVRRAVAGWLETPVQKLQAFAIDRNAETGDIVVRPEAVFG